MHVSHHPNQDLQALGLAILAAMVVHALLILGLSFDLDLDSPPPPRQRLDVTLVRPAPRQERPEEADFLAQQSHQGGGETRSEERPKAPPSPTALRPKPHPAPRIRRAGTPPAKARPAPRLVTTRRAEHRELSPPSRPEVAARPRPDAAQLLASTQQEIDRLTAEIDRHRSRAAHQERRKAISASTQEYRYAAYMEAWRKKVERIGNLNYPDEVRRRGLFGSLILHVAVRADGSVENIRVVRSSGHRLLDDAAVRIVRLAAPFAPFPAEIRKEVDVLDITRTWQFLDGRSFTSG